MKKKIRPYIIDALFLFVGSCIYAVAIDTFLSPNRIISGGASGLSIVINSFTHIPIGTLIIIINIPLFIAAFIKQGIKPFIRTGIATLASSVFVDIGALFLPQYTDEPLLAALFGGLLSGLGLGIIYLRGMATGGSDLLAKLLGPKMPWVSYGTMIAMIDIFVVAAAFIAFRTANTIFFALIQIFVSTQVIDLILTGPDKGKLVYIISAQHEQIADRIMKDIQRGVTYLDSEGAYTGEKKRMIMVVVRKQELFRIKNIVRQTDEKAFVIVGEASEILGNGFEQKYKENQE